MSLTSTLQVARVSLGPALLSVSVNFVIDITPVTESLDLSVIKITTCVKFVIDITNTKSNNDI